MNKKIYCVYDVVSGMHLQPVLHPNDAAAIRVFTDAINSRDTALGAHPSDYNLMCLGAFSETDGTIVAKARPELIIKGIDCVLPTEK